MWAQAIAVDLGSLAPTRGKVIFKGRDITGLPAHRTAHLGIGRSFQITNIFPRLSVFENIRCATLYALGYRYSFWHRLAGLTDAADRAEDILERIGLKSRHDTQAGLLTYAEQRALEIGEVEFKDNDGQPSGKKIYVQLKSGNSYLRTRKSDGQEVFDVKNDRHLEYWMGQPVDVYLVVRQTEERTGEEAIRWMNVTRYLKNQQDKKSRQIIFQGEALTMQAVWKLRDEFFRV